MTDSLNLTGRVSLSTEGVDAALKGVGDSATKMGKDVGGAAKKAGEALDGIGKGSEKSTQQFTRDGSRVRDEISRTTKKLTELGLKASEKLELKIQAKGLDAAQFEPYLRELRRVEAATKEVSSATKEWGDITKTASNLIAGALAGITIGAGFQKFIKETIDSQNEQAQLAAVLRSTGEAAGFTQQKLNDMAGALSGKSIFSAGDINEAQTRLLSYTGVVGEQFPRAIQNAIDMAQRLGTDVKSSAETIGKALDVPSQGLSALSKQGFRFTESQKELVEKLEATGRAAEAQNIILDALESSYGGAAEAARNTLGGALAGLQNAFDDLMTGGDGGAEGLAKSINNLSDALGSAETKAAFQMFTGWMADLSTAAVKGAANLLAFIAAKNKLSILAGSDEFGKLTSSAAEYSQSIKLATEKAERFQTAISRGDNVEQNQRNLAKTTEFIRSQRNQLVDATQALKDYANANQKVADVAPGATTKGPIALSAPKIDKAAISAANRELGEQSKLLAELNGLSGSFYKDWDRLTAVFKKGGLSLEQLTAAQESLLSKQPGIKAAADAQAKATEAIAKAELAAAQSREKYLVSLDAGLDKIKADTQAQIEATKRLGLSKEAIAKLDAAKLEMLATDLELQAIKKLEKNLDEEAYNALKAQAAAYRDLAKAKEGGAAREAVLEAEKVSADAAKSALDEWKKTADDIERALTDSLMRGFESGKDMVSSLRDYIVNAFKTMVVKVAVKAIMGSISGFDTGTGGATGASGKGGFDYTSMFSSQGFESAAANGFDKAGQFLINNSGTNEALGDFGASLTSNSAKLGQYTNTLATGLSYVDAATKFKDGSYGESIGQAAGTYIGGPIGGQIGAALGAALDDAINYTIEAKGGAYVAQASGMGASSVALRSDFEQNGGLFGGGTTQNSEWADADASIRGYFDTSIAATTASVKKYADALGLAPDAVDGFKKQIEVSITGLDAAGQQAAINKAIGGFVDEMVTSAYGGALSALSKTGETSGQTLERLAVSLGAVNASFDALGRTLLPIGVEGAATAAALADVFGGLDKLQAGVGAYYQAFYSETERAANGVANLQEAFASLGIAVPESKEAFRALVDSLDVTTDSGRNLYASVINLAPAFEQASQAAQAAAQIMLSAIQNYGTSAEVRDFQVNQIGDALRAAGIGVDNATIASGTRDQYRAAYEQFVASGDTKAANALLAQQQAFASITQPTRQAQQSSGGGGGSFAPVANAALDAWKKATEAIVSAMKDLRVTLLDQGPDNFARLQSQFTIDVAKAQAGDLGAYEELQKLINPLVNAQKGISGSGIEETLFIANLYDTLDQLTTRISGQSFFNSVSPSAPPAPVYSVPNVYTPPSPSGADGATVAELREQNRLLNALLIAGQTTAANTGKAAKTLENAAVGVQPLTTIAA